MDAVIGLGSNLGSRFVNLQAAIRLMTEADDLELISTARVLESEALSVGQPSYLNSGVRVRWSGHARSLLDRLQDIERRLGRIREADVRWAPRPIDLDILWIKEQEIDLPGLRVPHPQLCNRAFALSPLIDLLDDKEASPFRHQLRELPQLSSEPVLFADYFTLSAEPEPILRAPDPLDLLALALNFSLDSVAKAAPKPAVTPWTAPRQPLERLLPYCLAHRPAGTFTTLTHTEAGQHHFRSFGVKEPTAGLKGTPVVVSNEKTLELGALGVRFLAESL